ncbi:MAG TPA: ABC transporter permease [Fibrobacteria bacterium]|nr:ABC transporter permease [Fibrobacteria bacterium]
MAIIVDFDVTGVTFLTFTSKNLKQYAVLKAMGATPRLLLSTILAQAGVCALIGTGLGLGICGITGRIVVAFSLLRFSALRWFSWSVLWQPCSARSRS